MWHSRSLIIMAGYRNYVIKTICHEKGYLERLFRVFNEEIKLYPWSGSKVSGMIEHRTFVSVEGNDEPTFYTYGRYSFRKPV